jgi:hypothetical protein
MKKQKLQDKFEFVLIFLLHCKPLVSLFALFPFQFIFSSAISPLSHRYACDADASFPFCTVVRNSSIHFFSDSKLLMRKSIPIL